VKLVHLIFETQFEAEVIGLLHREVGVRSYARLDDVMGAHAVERKDRRAYRVDSSSSMIIIVCEDDIAGQIMAGLAALRTRLGHGIHAYAAQAEQFV